MSANPKLSAARATDILRDAKRQPEQRVESVRHVIQFFGELDVFGFVLGYNEIVRGRITPVVKQAYWDRTPPDTDTGANSVLSHKDPRNPYAGLTQYWTQPGDRSAALRKRFGPLGLVELRPITGEEDADMIDTIQEAILPPSALELLKQQHGHDLMDEHLNAVLGEFSDEPKSVEYQLVELMIRSNLAARDWKSTHLMGIQAESDDRKAGGDGRNAIDALETEWLNETGLVLSKNVGRKFSKEAFGSLRPAADEAQPMTQVVLPPEFYEAIAAGRGGAPAPAQVDIATILQSPEAQAIIAATAAQLAQQMVASQMQTSDEKAPEGTAPQETGGQGGRRRGGQGA